ncbi:MAG: hypothetical protein ACC652_01745, partial [Acidimicrobiales bacterium]
ESAELEHLLKELAGSVYVRSSSAELERARVRVTKAIRRSIQLIGEQSPALGTHLETSVETGRRCLYSPPQGAAWEIREI